MSKQNFLPVRGKVIKLLRDSVFHVECENGKIVIANVASRFRTSTGRRKAKIVVGDRVIVEINLGDLEKGQIVGFSENF